MSFVKKVLLIFFILSVFTSPAKAETIKLITGVPENTPAFKLCRKLLDAIGMRMNATITLSSFPQRRVNFYLKNKAIFHGDFGRATAVETKVSGLTKVKEPVGKVWYYILTAKDIRYSGIKDLKKYSVAYKTGGYTLRNFLTKRAKTLYTLESTEKCLRFILAGRADIVIEDNLSLGNLLKKEPFKGKIKRLEPPVYFDNVYTYFLKKYADIAKRYELALIAIKKDGTYRQIMSSFRKSAIEYIKK